MRKITKILHVEEKLKDGKPYYKTTAVLDGQDEAVGYGRFEVGDKVEYFFHDKWDTAKMQKPSRKPPKPIKSLKEEKVV